MDDTVVRDRVGGYGGPWPVSVTNRDQMERVAPAMLPQKPEELCRVSSSVVARTHPFDEAKHTPNMVTSFLFRLRGVHAFLCFAALMPLASAQTSQFELLPIVEKVGNRPHVSWSDGSDHGVTYQANADNQSIKFWINIPEPGTYNIKVRHRRYGDRGQVQHLINNVNQGSVGNFYKSGSADFVLFDIGNKVFNEPGIKTLELRAVGAGGNGKRFISVDYVQTTLVSAGPNAWEYEDDFEDETTGQDPSHWIESNDANEWTVDSSTGSKTYMHPANITSTVSWLHVFERDVEVSARVMFKSKMSGSRQVRLLARYNHENACIMAGYDFNPSSPPRWHIMERQGNDDSWQQLTPADESQPMQMNQWYEMKLVARGSNVAFYVNDMQHPKLFAKGTSTHLSPGRVGLMADGVEAYFDDVKVQLVHKHGRVQNGVLEYTLRPTDTKIREGATLVAMDGKIELLHRRERFTSTDNGQTFTGPTGLGSIPDDRHAHTAVLRLNSGKLLKLQGEYDPNEPDSQALRYRARRSSDEGATWDTGGLTWTNYRVGGDGKSEIIQMNDKLSQTPGGRVFFVATARRYSGSTHIGHKCEVYYSDDEGTTWTKSAGDTVSWDAAAPQWIRFAEGKVIATGTPNELRLITTWVSNSLGQPAGTMRYMTSLDNGLTWIEDAAMSSFPCARSSFAVDRDLSAAGLVYYMVWVFNDPADHPKLMFPRSRLGLVKSTDGKNWTYLMDVERWISPDDPDGNPIVQIVDPGIMVTSTHVFVTMGLSDQDVAGKTHNAQKLRIVRIDKSKLTPRSWPTEY